MMFRDMTDEQLEAAISEARARAYRAGEVASLNDTAPRGTRAMIAGNWGRAMRDLDIAVAIKRQRIKAGRWTR